MAVGFWTRVRRPALVMAPMINVTDCAFRHIIATRAKPDVVWTEFVSVDGLLHDDESHTRIRKQLMYTPLERPIVAQLFGAEPHKFYQATKLVKQFGFDG